MRYNTLALASLPLGPFFPTNYPFEVDIQYNSANKCKSIVCTLASPSVDLVAAEARYFVPVELAAKGAVKMYMCVMLLHHVCNAEVEYPCLSGERRHLPCINFKDSARPAELPRWLSWYSICLEHRTSWVRVPPEAALLFLWGKKELSSGVVAWICLVSITDYTCTIMYAHSFF